MDDANVLRTAVIVLAVFAVAALYLFAFGMVVMTEIEEQLAARQSAYLNYAIDHAMKLESGVLQLYHLCKEGRQDDGEAAWELLKTLAKLATENDLRGYIAGIDRRMDAASAEYLRAEKRLH